MFFSPALKSSAHAAVSPDGKLVAILLASSITITSVASLELINTIKLPSGLSAEVKSFLWSPTSECLVLDVSHHIHVLSALSGGIRATISNPMGVTSRNSFVHVGPTSSQIVVCSAFGLKFVMLDLNLSRSWEIGNPKFFSPRSASRGFCFRPRTSHLALLTRSLGRDLVSLHHPVTRELQRSWHPDTVDAQSISWAQDGRWLVVCESPAHSHKALFYTPDGYLFKTWAGPAAPAATDRDFSLGAGIRTLEFSKDGKHIVVGDHSRCIWVLDATSVTERALLQHPRTVTPSPTTKIWQAQLTVRQTGSPVHAFIKATHSVSPPPPPASEYHDSKLNNPNPACRSDPSASANSATDDHKCGVGFITVDASGTLLASVLEEAPTTVWIWDLTTADLRAVLMFHRHVGMLSWHPSIRELLAIKCEGGVYEGVLFAWDPLWEGPRTVSFADHLHEGKAIGTSRWSWLNAPADSGTLFFADSREAMFASLMESDEEVLPWQGNQQITNEGGGETGPRREEPPLELVPVEDDSKIGSDIDGDIAELDDTFRFKRVPGW